MRYRQDRNPNRQKFIATGHGKAMPSGAPVIKDLEELRLRLQEAISLEHYTVPPYLCALYSLKGGVMGPNKETFKIILSVAMEEMLHMIMAANILNAIGGKPRICQREFLPKYPSSMPHSAIGFQVNLLKFSKEAVNTFLRIERPAARTGPTPYGKFWSIGEFYEAVRESLNRLHWEAMKMQKKGIFTGDPRFQVTDEYYDGGGKLVDVKSIDDANRAIDEIVGQGEGIDGSIDDGDDTMFGEDIELAHYFRFNEVFNERCYRSGDKASASPTGKKLKVDWDAVHNMVPNPTSKMFKKRKDVYERVMDFNRTYTKMLRCIEESCTGDQKALRLGIALMHDLANQAPELMQMESGIGDFMAGPCFEFVS